MIQYTRIELPSNEIMKVQKWHVPLLMEKLGKIPTWKGMTRHQYTLLDRLCALVSISEDFFPIRQCISKIYNN